MEAERLGKQTFCGVISVEEQPRSPGLLKHLKDLGIDIDFIGGVDMRREPTTALSDLVDASSSYLGRPSLTPAEVGCALSHRQVWNRFLESSAAWALVVEDDATVKQSAPELIEAVVSWESSQPLLVSLAHHPVNVEFFPLSRKAIWKGEQSGIYPVWSQSWGTCAYLMNRAAAEVLTRQGRKVDGVADWPFEASLCAFHTAFPPAFAVSDCGSLLPGVETAAASQYTSGTLARSFRGLERRLQQFWRHPSARRHPLAYFRWNQGAWPLYGPRLPHWLSRLQVDPATGDQARFWRLSGTRLFRHHQRQRGSARTSWWRRETREAKGP